MTARQPTPPRKRASPRRTTLSDAPIPSSKRRRITAVQAYEAYVMLGPHRSILALHNKLVADGWNVGRATLNKWNKRYGWVEAAKREPTVMAENIAEAVLDVAEAAAGMKPLPRSIQSPAPRDVFSPGTDTLKEAVDNLCLLTTAMVQHVADALPGMRLVEVDDALVMARCAAAMAEAGMKVRQGIATIEQQAAERARDVLEQGPSQVSGFASAMDGFVERQT